MTSKKSSEKDINLRDIKIKNKSDLSDILDALQEQGFGYIKSDWELHKRKIDSIRNENNVHNIQNNNIERDVNELTKDDTDYDVIDKKIKKYFTKYNPDDKIKEILNSFYLSANATCRPPSHRSPDRIKIFEWSKFKKKWKLKGEPDFGWTVSVYDLDKNFIKINNAGSDYNSSFDLLYKLIFGEVPNIWQYKMTGSWQNLGKVEVKLFSNGSMNVKGDIEKFKKYYFDIAMKGHSNVIFYNKKQYIREKNPNY